MPPLPKPLQVVPIEPPPPDRRARRAADFAPPGERPTRYHLPEILESPTPVGYRTRLALTPAEAAQALTLLALERPTSFVPTPAPMEGELFEEHALGVLSLRPPSNDRGLRVVTVGPATAALALPMLRCLRGLDAPPLEGAAYAHFAFARPLRTPFTALMTLAGSRPGLSLVQIPLRLLRQRLLGTAEVPTSEFLPHLHVGILAEAMERAAVVASGGARRAQVLLAPFAGRGRDANRDITRQLEDLAGLTAADRRDGWHLALVAQVGGTAPYEAVPGEPATWRKLGAGLLAFRSERIQPGVNQGESAPPAYGERQLLEVPPALTEQAGRAAYNAFAHWTGCDRECAKQLVLLDRVDVTTMDGKQRVRELRLALDRVTDRLLGDLPVWADLASGRVLSRRIERGRRACALAGQRIYVGGLSRREVEAAGLDFLHAVRAFGAGAARSALYVELMGVVNLPDDCDLLAGACLMARPVQQNDLGKKYYGDVDLLAARFPGREPTSLLVWTLKAKTVADPLGDEFPLPGRDFAAAVAVEDDAQTRHFVPLRTAPGLVNRERAFAEVGNFVTAPDGREIPGNRGALWPAARRSARLWTGR